MGGHEENPCSDAGEQRCSVGRLVACAVCEADKMRRPLHGAAR
jgi:hypothetical protein